MEMKNRVQAKQIAVYTGHTGNLYALAVDEKQGVIYTSGTDGLVIAWDINEPGKGKIVAKLAEAVHCLYYDLEKNFLWIGTNKGNVHVIDLTNKKEIKLFASHTQALFDIKKLGEFMYSAGGDGCLVQYEIETLSIKKIVKLSEKSLRSVAVSEERAFLAVGSSDSNIYLLSKNLEIFDEIEAAHTLSVFSLAFCSEGQCLLSGGRDAMMGIWDLRDGIKLVQKIAAHNLHVHGLAVHPEGKYLLSSSMDKTIKIWDLHTYKLLRVMDKERHNCHINSINKIAWLGAHKFVSISDDKSVMLWEVNS
ncbi:MAG: WD40 repeat domain-containing protein [Bacteroidia bacterium]|nr:WD40 repeat domain-containing protein [Bacteroidia bacterium]